MRDLIDALENNERKLGNRGWRITNEVKVAEQLDTQVKFRLCSTSNEELEARAKALKVSKAELIRTYIEWGLEND